MMIDGEKREAKRVSHICEIHCEGTGISKLSTRILDISTAGVFIDSLAHFPVGAALNLRFTVLGVPIEVEGEVRYCMAQIGMGIQFRNLKPQYRYTIECLVDNKPFESTVFASLVFSPNAIRPNHAGSVFRATPVVQQQSPAELQMIMDETIILMGDFADIGLLDVVQMVENSRVSGELVIFHPSGAGEIYFDAGHIANARSGQNYGIKALHTFLNLTEGSFRFRKTMKSYAQIIQATSNQGLLLSLRAADNEEVASL